MTSKDQPVIHVGDRVQFTAGERTHEGTVASVQVAGTSDPLLQLETDEGRPYLRLVSEVALVKAREKM